MIVFKYLYKLFIKYEILFKLYHINVCNNKNIYNSKEVIDLNENKQSQREIQIILEWMKYENKAMTSINLYFRTDYTVQYIRSVTNLRLLIFDKITVYL